MFDELINQITNVDVFTNSLQEIIQNFSINSLIMIIMMFFTVVGAIDKIRGNKKGYGEKFDEGFNTMGPMAVAMIGVMTLAPILQLLLQPIISPIYEFFGASPAMFAGTILPIDAGAYPLAMQLAGDDIAIGNFSGLILGGTMGVLIIALIPLAMNLMEKEDRPFFSGGVLVGLITIPIGCLVGGLLMNLTPYKMGIGTIVVNLIPVIIVALLIAVGLWFKPGQVMRGFNAFGNVMQVLIVVSATLAIVQFITGLRLPLASLMVEASEPGGLSPLEESIFVVGNIGIIMTGAFPLIHWITKTFNKGLNGLGKRLGMNEIASSGLVASLASILPTLSMVKDMNNKGKFLNIAFLVCAGWAFGDHLGYVATVNSDMIFPVILCKLVAAITALLLANRLSEILMPRIMDSMKKNDVKM